MTGAKSLGSIRRRAAGVSLIEALVALAVMAFGMLGVVGMQSTMRTGADISRQRSEAVRIAQEELERLRNYSVVASAPGKFAFENITTAAPASVAASNSNTTFILETVVPAPAADAMARVRQVQVSVAWADRSASAPNQRVDLSTTIAGLPAEMSGLHAMRTDRSPLGQFKGRNAAIPRDHIFDNGNGTSTFTPPGLGGITWKFNNASALIYEVCTAPPTPTCTPTERWLLSGFVAFATGAAPTPTEAEFPGDPVVSLVMTVAVTLPESSVENCATESVGTDRLAYYCALPTEPATGGQRWSGRVEFSGLPLAASLADTTPGSYRICRYTPDKVNRTSPTALNLGPPSADVPTGQTNSQYNSRHPYAYFRAVGPQVNKNFLVISAGLADDPVAYSCPADDPGTLIESNTWPHQPIS